MACFASLVLICLAPETANSSLEEILADNGKLIIKSSSKTVEPVLEQFTRNGGTGVEQFLNNWQAKKLYFIKESGRFVLAEKAAKSADGKKLSLIHI